MNVSKILLNGVEYNLTDNDAQSKINEIKETTYTKSEIDEAIDAIPSYDDTELSGRVSDLEAIDHSKYLTEHQNISNLATKAEVKEVSDKVDTIEVPTKVSQLTNDSGFISEHQSLEDYVKKADFVVNGETLEININ